jgi:TetR/AcrR family transcriptional regulator, transcriptional repressor of aconitase
MKPNTKQPVEGDDERRMAILDAALECFLKHGYAKTSLDDIARAAHISRPLLYLKFKNKGEIFQRAFLHIIGDGYVTAEAAMDTFRNFTDPNAKKKAILAIYEALLLVPWDKVMDQPMASEFYHTCSELFPEVSKQHEQTILKYVSAILGDEELAMIFTLAVLGLQSDIPSTNILRNRIEQLTNRFM